MAAINQAMNSNVSYPGLDEKRAPIPGRRVQRRRDDRRLALEASYRTSDTLCADGQAAGRGKKKRRRRRRRRRKNRPFTRLS